MRGVIDGIAFRLNHGDWVVSRLESPGYEGHSLSTLRRVAGALHARVRIVFEPLEPGNAGRRARTATSKPLKRATDTPRSLHNDLRLG